MTLLRTPGRILLVRIMDTIVNKFVTLKERIPCDHPCPES